MTSVPDRLGVLRRRDDHSEAASPGSSVFLTGLRQLRDRHRPKVPGPDFSFQEAGVRLAPMLCKPDGLSRQDGPGSKSLDPSAP